MMSTQIGPIDPVVFYDPRNPALGCLVAGPDELTLLLPIMGSVAGLALLTVGVR
jgi:hypothetical protein